MNTLERTRVRTPLDRPRPQRGGVSRRAQAAGWVIMALACVYIAVAMSRYLSFDPDVYFPEQLQNYVRLEFVLGVHVLCGMLALLIGPFQFVRRLRRRFVRLHRACGAVYLASATGLGVSGLILAPTAYTGLGASVAFALLGLGTLFTTWTALRMVLAGRYAEHRRWMIRSFSLIMAGVMLRVWMPLYGGLAAVGLVHFSYATAYAAVAWLCWVPNLLIALWITRRPVERAPAA